MPEMHSVGTPYLLRKLQATVAPEILPPVTCFTLIAVIIVVVSKQTGYNLEVSTVMLSVLSTMISFAISLRTSSALERYNEGRKAWSQISLCSRNLAFIIWMQLPQTTLNAAQLKEAEGDPHRMEHEKAKGLIEKRTVINLIEAFAVASKHYLRGESGVYYEDLYHLVAPLPKYAYTADEPFDDRASVLGLWRQPNDEGRTPLPMASPVAERSFSSSVAHSAIDMSRSTSTSDTKRPNSPVQVRHPLLPAFNPPPKTIYDLFPPAALVRPFVRWFSSNEAKRARAARKKGKRYHKIASNVPLEISMFISTWISAVIRRKTLDGPFITVIHTATSSMQDAVTTLERVRSTPLPFAYQAHLRFSIYIFLLLLPFQIYEALGYLTIVAVAVSGTIFLGFLEIATQIEDPFGYDDSDHDLDHFCALIAAELREIVAHPQPDIDSFVLSPLNQPFHPTDTRTATEILEHLHHEFQHSAATAPGGEGRMRGADGFRRVAAKHFHDMDGLGKIEREMEGFGIDGDKGKRREVDVLLV